MINCPVKLLAAFFLMFAGLNSYAQTTNSFPQPVPDEVSSTNHVDPVMYCGDWCETPASPQKWYYRAYRFVKHDDELYILTYATNYAHVTNSCFWAKLDLSPTSHSEVIGKKTFNVPDYMSIQNNENRDEKLFIDGQRVVMKNTKELCHYNPSIKNGGDCKYLVEHGESFVNHARMIPTKQSAYDYKIVAFNTLASIPDKEPVSYTHLTLPTNREV